MKPRITLNENKEIVETVKHPSCAKPRKMQPRRLASTALMVLTTTKQVLLPIILSYVDNCPRTGIEVANAAIVKIGNNSIKIVVK